MKLKDLNKYFYRSKYYMNSVDNQRKQMDIKNEKKRCRDIAEKEQMQSSKLINTDEDVLENIIRELEYKYVKPQFYKAKL